MANFDELIEALKSLLTEQFSPKPNYIRGVLGDGTGVVDVPGRPDYDYARFNRGSTEAFEIFNKNAPSVDGWPVLIGEFPWMPGLTQVVGTDWAAYEQSGWGDSVTTSEPHAPTHEWRDGFIGADPLNIYRRAIAPGRAYSTEATGTVVFVNAFEYYTGTIWPGTPGVDLSPIRDALATGNAQFAGIYVDTNNTLGVVTGTTAVDTAAFDPPLVTFPWGTIPIARVRIAGGQGGITESNIRDARILWDFPPTGSAIGGPAGGDLTGTYPNPQVAGLFGSSLLDLSPSEGDVLMFSGTAWQPIAGVGGGSGWPFDIITVDATDTDADYSTITAAVAAASANDIILVGPGTYTGRLTPSVALTIAGSGYRETIIEYETAGGLQGVIAPTANLNLINLTIQDAGTAATRAINTTSAITITLKDCQITINNTASIQAINGSAGDQTLILENCDIDASGTSTDAILLATAGSSAEIIGGSISSTNDATSGNATYTYRGVKITSGTFNASSTHQGQAASAEGRIVEAQENANYAYQGSGVSDSDFVATINGAPSGTSVVYNAPSSGSEDVLVPVSTSQIAKMVLHNTTRGDDALISNCNTGTNTITLTATVPGTWANSDTITVRSQTNTSSGAAGGSDYFVDFEITSGVDTLTTRIFLFLQFQDSGSAQAIGVLHPYQANSNPLRKPIRTYAASRFSEGIRTIDLVSSRFCFAWNATGSATATFRIALDTGLLGNY